MRHIKKNEDRGGISLDTAIKFIALYEEAFNSNLIVDEIGNHEGMWELCFTNNLATSDGANQIHHFMKSFKNFFDCDTNFNYQITTPPLKYEM